MKSVNELLDDLAEELQRLRNKQYPWENSLNKAQQLVGHIRQKLKDEQWKPR